MKAFPGLLEVQPAEADLRDGARVLPGLQAHIQASLLSFPTHPIMRATNHLSHLGSLELVLSLAIKSWLIY